MSSGVGCADRLSRKLPSVVVGAGVGAVIAAGVGGGVWRSRKLPRTTVGAGVRLFNKCVKASTGGVKGASVAGCGKATGTATGTPINTSTGDNVTGCGNEPGRPTGATGSATGATGCSVCSTGAKLGFSVVGTFVIEIGCHVTGCHVTGCHVTGGATGDAVVGLSVGAATGANVTGGATGVAVVSLGLAPSKIGGMPLSLTGAATGAATGHHALGIPGIHPGANVSCTGAGAHVGSGVGGTVGTGVGAVVGAGKFVASRPAGGAAKLGRLATKASSKLFGIVGRGVVPGVGKLLLMVGPVGVTGLVGA